jgi:hypothetical protein
MHFYTKTGEPAHTQNTKKGAKNPTRPTNIQDARKYGLLASVSTIMENVLANHSLNNWKQRQLLEKAYELRPCFDESIDEWSSVVIEKASESRESAANLGTSVHKAIENGLNGNLDAIPLDLKPMVDPALAFIANLGLKGMETEKTVVNEHYNYAGTLDVSGIAIIKGGLPNPLIIDIKTKRTKEGEKIEIPETYPWQLAAYHAARFGLSFCRLHPQAMALNLFISSTEIGRIDPVWYEADELDHAWQCFLATNRLFQLRNKLNHDTNTSKG